jgi:hypothetical protein
MQANGQEWGHFGKEDPVLPKSLEWDPNSEKDSLSGPIQCKDLVAFDT